jgi:tungstate transport system ATP-binding protein
MLDRTRPFRERAMLPLAASGIVFARGGRRLIDGVSISIGHDMRTVLMGPNGAGKSLLLRILHGLVVPDAGNVTWAGRPADADVARRQAMVFQKPVLLRRSVRDNIGFVLRHLDRDDADARIVTALEQAQLSQLADSPARRLSGGEQQRLAIIRALVNEPDILFLDEPCSNLDPASTLAIEDLIGSAHRSGTKIILVTHDIGQARRIADEIVFMSSGRVVEQQAAREFFASPRAEAARAYLEGQLYVDAGSATGRDRDRLAATTGRD